MKILIDTNIIIALEDNKTSDDCFYSFYRLAIANGCEIVYHPQAIPSDLGRDKNEKRREMMFSKLKKYTQLQSPAPPTSDFIERVGQNNNHDKADNHQLYQLYLEFVDFLVTEDKGIHRKAESLGIGNRVLNIRDAYTFLKEKFTFSIPQHPSLREGSIREICQFLDTSFFDSLKADYDSEKFTEWFQKCVRQNRPCYYITSEGQLRALLIYNRERTEDHQLPNIYEDALKICTLKVDESVTGVKLGELFLQKMFEFCIVHEIHYLYITSFPKQKQLTSLLEDFGFKSLSPNDDSNRELKFVKYLSKKTGYEGITRKSHPFYSDNATVGKYAIPIRPEYYCTLFKDGRQRQPELFDQLDDSLNEIQGNTIKKAYICKAYKKEMKVGDLLFFYASQSSKVIEPIGILESIQMVSDTEELWRLVHKRTVFSREELQKRLAEAKSLTVILFRLVTYMPKPVTHSEIKTIESFRNKIQTITWISEEDYTQLKQKGHFDGRFIVD